MAQTRCVVLPAMVRTEGAGEHPKRKKRQEFETGESRDKDLQIASF